MHLPFADDVRILADPDPAGQSTGCIVKFDPGSPSRLGVVEANHFRAQVAFDFVERRGRWPPLAGFDFSFGTMGFQIEPIRIYLTGVAVNHRVHPMKLPVVSVVRHNPSNKKARLAAGVGCW
jgi:hypothetical protein